MKNRKYLIPPRMTRKVMIGGWGFWDAVAISVTSVALPIVFFPFMGFRALLTLAVPFVYAFLSRTPPGSPYNGVDFFKRIIRYLWMPQQITMPPSKFYEACCRKEEL